jgi:hypothetical protein
MNISIKPEKEAVRNLILYRLLTNKMVLYPDRKITILASLSYSPSREKAGAPLSFIL